MLVRFNVRQKLKKLLKVVSIPPKNETSMNVYNQPTNNFRDLNRKRKVLEKLEISKARKNKLELLNGIN